MNLNDVYHPPIRMKVVINLVTISDGRALRSKENTREENTHVSKVPPPEMKKAFQRIKAVFDSDSE